MPQEPVKTARHSGQHHVVHGGSQRPLDVLEGLHRGLDHREPPVRADLAIERTGRGKHPTAHDVSETAQDLARLAGHTGGRFQGALGQIGEPLGRMRHLLHHRVEEEVQPARLGLRFPGRRRQDLGLGGEVVDRGRQVDCRHAVHHAVVNLRQDGGEPVLHPLDQVQLPQWLGAVERPRDHSLDVVDELAPPPGGGQGRPTHVEGHVEVRVVDPDRPGRGERGKQNLLAKPGGQMQARRDDPNQIRIRQLAARRGGRIQDGHAAHMLVDGRCLQVEERGVLRP